MIATLALPLALLGLQQGEGIADRLAGRVSPEIAALVNELGAAAATRGLPIDPLIQKAIEGSAKGIPAERVATAVRLVAVQLDTAAAALRETLWSMVSEIHSKLDFDYAAYTAANLATYRASYDAFLNA